MPGLYCDRCETLLSVCTVTDVRHCLMSVLWQMWDIVLSLDYDRHETLSYDCIVIDEEVCKQINKNATVCHPGKFQNHLLGILNAWSLQLISILVCFWLYYYQINGGPAESAQDSHNGDTGRSLFLYLSALPFLLLI